MGAIVAIAGGKAKPPSAGRDTNHTQVGYLNSAICLTVRNLFPRKTWAALASMIGCSERVAKHRMSASRPFTAHEIALLLRTEHGIHFLSGLMGEARPAWYRWFLAHVAAGNARRALRRQEQELREAINAVENLNGAVVRADAALAFQDEDFMRPHVDGLHYAHRVPNSPLATTRGAKR